jgi:hypothetical protein
MSTRFNTAVDRCAQVTAGELSSVEMLLGSSPGAIVAQLFSC